MVESYILTVETFSVWRVSLTPNSHLFLSWGTQHHCHVRASKKIREVLKEKEHLCQSLLCMIEFLCCGFVICCLWDFCKCQWSCSVGPSKGRKEKIVDKLRVGHLSMVPHTALSWSSLVWLQTFFDSSKRARTGHMGSDRQQAQQLDRATSVPGHGASLTLFGRLCVPWTAAAHIPTLSDSVKRSPCCHSASGLDCTPCQRATEP